jgi:hypothetical protein
VRALAVKLFGSLAAAGVALAPFAAQAQREGRYPAQFKVDAIAVGDVLSHTYPRSPCASHFK